MIHIRVFDARDKQIAEIAAHDVEMSDAHTILDLIGQAVAQTGDRYQAFSARVEDETGKGFWMGAGESPHRPAKPKEKTQ